MKRLSFISQFKIESLLLFTNCRKVPGKMPGLGVETKKTMSVKTLTKNMKKLIQFISFNFLFCGSTIVVITIEMQHPLSFYLTSFSIRFLSFSPANLTHKTNSSPIILTVFSLCFTWIFNFLMSSGMWSACFSRSYSFLLLLF